MVKNNKWLVTALLFLVLCVSWETKAQTPVSEDMANNYFYNCLKTPDPRLSQETQEALCACSSVKMMESLSVEDMKTMGGDTQDSRLALNKMLMHVYAPCMELPVWELIYNNCQSKELKLGHKTCVCLADEMASYTAENAQKLLGGILKTKPNITDPMGPIVNSSNFKRHEQRVAMLCASKK